MTSFIDDLFAVAVSNKAQIIRAFIVFYCLLVVFLFFGGRSVYLRDDLYPFIYDLGLWSGKIAIVLYSITLLPGMAKRFGIQNKFFSIIRIFRRYIGISTFLFAFTHASFMRLILFLPQVLMLRVLLFELFGIVSLIILFCMFLTSNDVSVNRLGIWWYRLHRLTNVIMIAVLFHTLLQRVSVWSVFIGIVVLVQLTSFAVSYSRKSA